MNQINKLEIINYIFTVAALSLTIFYFLISKKNKTSYHSKSSNTFSIKNEAIIFSIIILISLSARIFLFGSVPNGINQDEAMAAVDARALANYGTNRYGMYFPVHFTGWGYGQMSVFLSYCMIPFIKIMGFNTVAVRLPLLIASMLGLLALYFGCRIIFGQKAAIITLILSSINPWHFMQSRWSLDSAMFPHMFIIGFSLLLFGLSKKRICLFISIVFFAICMYSYGISFYTVPPFLLVVFIYYLRKRLIKLYEMLICIGIYMLLSWPIYTTMIINALSLDTISTPFFTMAYFPNSVRSDNILFFTNNNVVTQLYKNLLSLLKIYIIGDNCPWDCVEGFGAINFCFLPFIFLGIIRTIHMIKNENDQTKKGLYLSLVVWLIIANLSGLITENVNTNRINILFYPLILFAGFGIYSIVELIKPSTIIIGTMYLLLSILFLRAYFGYHSKQLKFWYYSDYISAINYLSENKDVNIYILTPHTLYDRAINETEIVTLYALDIDAYYFQDKYADENGLYYSDKFIYLDATENDITSNNKTGYLVYGESWRLFNQEEFQLTSFGDYCVACPKQ